MQRSKSTLLAVCLAALVSLVSLRLAFVSAPQSQVALRGAQAGALAGAVAAPMAANAMEVGSSVSVAGLDDQLLQISIMTLVSTVSLSIAIVIWGRNGF